MILMKRKDAGIWNRERQIALSGELLEQAMDLSQDTTEWINIQILFQVIRTKIFESLTSDNVHSKKSIKNCNFHVNIL
jgi:hypothetical protein